MIGPAHHVGIAVQDLEAAVDRYRAFGLSLDYLDEVPGQHVRVAFLRAGGIRVELVTPTGPESTVASFLTKRGEGLHHLAFQVDDIASELVRLERQSFVLIDRAPRPGAHGRLVAFLHPRSAHGVLLELVQEPSRVHQEGQKS